MKFFDELKRRNVIRVGFAYAVVAWLIMQFADVVLDNIDAPHWIFQVIMLLLAIGLPLVLLFAWAFELTPEGIKKEKDVDRSESIRSITGRKLDRGVILLLLLALTYFAYDKFTGTEPEETRAGPQTVAVSEEQTSTPEQLENVDNNTAVQANSIAVLPFVNMSADPEQEYFSDGISEEILNVLVRVDELKVASRTSTFTYKGKNLDIPEIAKELKVANIVEGSVRKSGKRVRITAQLIDARNDRHLWSDTFDRELTDIFAIQDEIAKAIVAALKDKLGLQTAADTVSVNAATSNLTAYELYLKGRALFLARKDFDQSIQLLKQAVTLDSQFARAWEQLAAIYLVAPGWDDDKDRLHYYPLAISTADRALALDPALSIPWAVKGFIKMLLPASKKIDISEQRVKVAMQYMDKALIQDSKNATAYLWRGLIWSMAGFTDKAEADYQRCLAIDPAYNLCSFYRVVALYHLGEYDKALALYEQVIIAQPLMASPSGLFLPLLAIHGSRLTALLDINSADLPASFPGVELVDAILYPERGQTKGRQKFLDYVANLPAQDSYQWTLMAAIVFGIDSEIKRNYINPGVWLWTPGFPGLYKSQQFKEVIRDMGLPTYWREFGFPPQCRPVGDDDFECTSRLP